MTNLEQVEPQDQVDIDYQVNQVENAIFFNDNQPQRDNRFRCYEYSIFLFYKTNRINLDINLVNNWMTSGEWELGNYIVVQYDGRGPLSNVYENYNIIKNEMDRLKNLGQIDEYKIRYKYPELP
jgi:hypothetical protein